MFKYSNKKLSVMRAGFFAVIIIGSIFLMLAHLVYLEQR